MLIEANKYETAEVLAIGTSRDIILGVKDFPALDDLNSSGSPIYRTDWWPWFCDDSDSAD